MTRSSNRGRKFPAEILTREEIGALMRACSPRAPTGIRNRALIAILYRAGLRLAEALSLKPKDLDRDAGTLRVLRGKGRKARTVGMDPDGFAVLERWLDTRRGKLGINGACRVFCTLKGKPVKPSYIRALLPRLGLKAGIEKRVHAHGLRHALAVELAREGVPVPIISRQLGHANVRTTSVYLSGIAPEETVEAIRSRKWEGVRGDRKGSQPAFEGSPRYDARARRLGGGRSTARAARAPGFLGPIPKTGPECLRRPCGPGKGPMGVYR